MTAVTVPLALATHVLSPLKKVEELTVPVPSRAVGTEPLPKAEALRDVKFRRHYRKCKLPKIFVHRFVVFAKVVSTID